MKFSTVHINNFLSFKKEVFDLDSQGLTLILGENRGSGSKDSNGAGKSSLLDAFCWSLWGNTIKGLKDDEVINRLIGKECSVTTSFEDEGNTYKVTRYRKCKAASPHNGLRLYINEEDATQASVAATQAKITHILDMDFNTFQCMMPGSAIKIAQLTDTGIKTSLERLLQLEVFAKAQKLAKDKEKHIQSKLDQLQVTRASITEELDVNSANLVKLQQQVVDFDKVKADRLKKAQEEYDQAVSKVDSLPEYSSESNSTAVASKAEKEQEAIQLLVEIKEYEVKKSKVGQDFSAIQQAFIKDKTAIETRITTHNKAIKKTEVLGPVCTNCLQDIPVSKKAQVLQDLESEIVAEKSVLAKLESAYEVNTEAYTNDITSINTVINNSKDTYNKVYEVIEKLKKELTLAETSRQLRALYTEAVSKQETIVESIKAETCKVQDTIDWVKVRSKELTEKLVDYDVQVNTIQKQQDQLNFWVEGFSAKGLRPHLLRHVTPVLNRTVQRYADLATNGDIKIEFETEKTLKNGTKKSIFSIKVAQKDGGDTYKSASSGEKARADVCIALALGDLAASRSSKSINFRFLDEPFEGIDNSGLMGIVSLLTNQSGSFSSIFCVTHNQQLKEYFPKTLTVIKENKISRIKR